MIDESRQTKPTKEIQDKIRKRYWQMEETGQLARDLAGLSKMQKHALTTNGPHPH